MDEIKVLCGAPCGKTPVYDRFYDSFASLEIPEGSVKQRMTGGSVPSNLNALVKSAQDLECSHLFIVEDDSSFAADSLIRLLMHDKPVVTGLCRSRGAPFRPYIYSGLDEESKLLWRELSPEDEGLIKVAATGMGGILIQMWVFDKLDKPYFHSYYKGETEWGQDVVFGKSLIEAGIDVYCDTDVIIEHATQCTIGSEKVDGVWKAVVKINLATFKLS